MREIRIGKRIIGDNKACFIVAEIGSNHNQDFKIVYKLIDAAKKAGADAVKFQSFTVENWISKSMESFPTLKVGGNLYNYLKKYELPYPMYRKIKEYCQKKNIICFSSPSHLEDVKLLELIGTPVYKFGSVQITDLPTLEFAAKLGKPIILSTGASTISEIKTAVKVIRRTGNKNIILLHCTSLYPAPLDKLNLNLINTLKQNFNIPIGFSDHSMDPIIAPVAAAALGACVIEKHITLSRKMKGPDHYFALTPDEFKQMVEAIRKSEKVLGSSYKKIYLDETKMLKFGRRSIVANTDIYRGDMITRNMLTTKRPGIGISPKYLNNIIGKKARINIREDDIITWDKVKK